MIVLVTGDWHADAQIAGHRRTREVADAARAFVDRAVELLQEGRSVGVLVLGDMSDPVPPRCWRALQVVGKAMKRLDEFKIPSLWLTGNHDIEDDGHGSHSLLPLKPGLRYGQIADVDGIYQLGELSILCLPYVGRAQSYDPDLTVRSEAGHHVAAIAGHLMIEGIGPGSESDEFARGRDVFLPTAAIAEVFPGRPVFNGHYHKRQTFNGVEIPGSLIRLTLGEVENRPVWLEVEL